MLHHVSVVSVAKPSSFKAFAKRFLQFVRHWTSSSSTLGPLGSDFFDCRHSSKMRQQASRRGPMGFPGKIGAYQTCQIMWESGNLAYPILTDLEAWCVLKTIPE